MDSHMNIEYKIFIHPRRNLKIFRRLTLMVGKIEGVVSAHNRGIFWNKLEIFIRQVYNSKLCAVIFPEILSRVVLDPRETSDVRTFSVALIPSTRMAASPTHSVYYMVRDTESLHQQHGLQWISEGKAYSPFHISQVMYET
jgi:hypothetical protein